MSDAPTRRKLIEVALPLAEINAASAREKSIRHGHPSTLHLWWARRPLAACRAVLFGQLVDDPSSHPDRFPTEAEQDAERERLFEIIRKLVTWEASTDEEVLDAARKEIRDCFDGEPPAILDPFAGGGSIPLEAQRLGLEAYASDLNPVAVLINKALIEIPPRWAGCPPVHPEADTRTRWARAEGLAEDVRRYGAWMREEAERRIGHLYPDATLPDGSKARVIAWIWARTVICPNPACGATMPLVRSFWLGKKKGKEAWVRPVVEGKLVRFEIAHDRRGPEGDGTVTRTGASCLCCGSAVKFDHVRAEGRAGRMGAQLMAIAAEGDRRRVYLAPNVEHERAADVVRPDDVPDGELPRNPRDLKTPNYGITTWAGLFTNRQLTALSTFSDLVGEAGTRVEADARAAGLTADDATAYAAAIATYVALAVDRVSDRNSALTAWDSSPSKEQVRGVFARQAIPMVWDFAEGNIFGSSSGCIPPSIGWVANALEALPGGKPGSVEHRDARSVPGGCTLATDPPYYDNIGYADLSDFFYVWLRRSLRSLYPGLFATLVTPKVEELIATPYRHGGSKQKAEQYFEDGFVDVFEQARKHHPAGVPMTLFYAFKQSETVRDKKQGKKGGEKPVNKETSPIASTGWSTMLEGLAAAGWMVTATWPMRTELANKIGMKANMLASSVVLACRPRPESARVVDRQGLLRALREELPGPLRDLQKAHIAPVDLRQAAIGPGMAVFSRYGRVVEPDGKAMRVRTALGLINQVLEELLDEQQSEMDLHTRWAVQWFSQFFFDEGPYGTAEQLAVSMDVAVGALVDGGIVRSGQGKVRLLSRDELPEGWDPRADDRVSVWEATHRLVKVLEFDGEPAAAFVLRRLPSGLADAAQVLAYRLYTVCENTRPGLAGPYNALVASWPEIQRLAKEAAEPTPNPEQGTLDY